MVETMNRREQKRVHMAKQRAFESPSDTTIRQEQNRTRIYGQKENLITSIPVDSAIYYPFVKNLWGLTKKHKVCSFSWINV